MSRERCPSCPVDDSGMPCAAPRCPWSVDGVGLIAPVPFPRIGEPGHDEWMARGHEVRVAPAGATPRPYGHAEYDIFVQSTSVNRKLVPGTTLLLVR